MRHSVCIHNTVKPWVIAGAIALAAPLGIAAPAHNSADTQEYQARLIATRSTYFKVVAGGDAAADREAHAALAGFEQAFPGDATAMAYHGSLQLLDAAHSWQVWNLRKQAADGLSLLDEAVAQAPEDSEVRFLRAATDWHLPGFLHRREQAEADFAILAAHAEEDARLGKLPPELAAASLSYWAQILSARKDHAGSVAALEAAVRIAPQSPAGIDAKQRLNQLR
jgi:hypothetical protein